ncbi:hypothetical protein [Chondrinema litorale]|uniref:hypothetical protein n=1 Tax=Chondrinema litorale TaxID=2994555 RepID=UPI00254308E6|nr:hypothetical protein [Chondrinema litorale]UZR92641.1 hypothetical protein OQ292_12315 [Chondrinema litorale]
MLYFLVIIIPFAGYMAFLIYQNNLLKKDYDFIFSKLNEVSKNLEVGKNNSLKDLHQDIIVTSNSIKRLENYITAIEDFAAIQKQSVVSNTFKPKRDKLRILKNRITKLEKVIENKEAEAKQPTTAS